jgi:two-component system, cell cycle response regulator DivK
LPRILLVEDNEMNRDMLSRRLQRRGFDVVTADNGQDAITAARSLCPDLILMDITLPLLNGWDATKVIKADSHTRMIPILALTACAMTGDRERALRSGCDDYDTKPIDMARLLSKIARLLQVCKAS